MRLPLVLAAVGLVLAGCIAPSDVTPAALEQPDATATPTLVAHSALGALPVPEAWSSLDIGVIDTGFAGGEPTIGVTSDGSIFITAGGSGIARSRDNGASFQALDMGPLGPKASLDPWIYVDPWTDRVFNAPLYVVCTWAAWSDDMGDSWSGANPATGCGVPAHDHQKLTSGPPAQGVTTMGYDNVLYYSYNSFRGEGTWISASYDGGMTWSVGQSVHAPSDQHNGVAGPVAVGPEGTAYSPKPADGGLAIATTRDSGASWETPVLVDGAGIYQALATTVDAAVDAAGNAYAVYGGKDGQMYLTRSTDFGESWSAPFRVSPPEVNMTVFAVVTAGEAGKLSIGYLGTTSDVGKAKTAQEVEDDVVWHAWMSFTEDALADDPVFTSVQVTPEDDPAQRGCVWLSGGGSACRNLLDFIDLVHLDGRAYMVYADGCAKCASASESRGRDVFVAVVQSGPSLVSGVLAPLGEVVEGESSGAREFAPSSGILG